MCSYILCKRKFTDSYELQSNYLDKFHQRLWLIMKIMAYINNDFYQLINVNISVNNSSSDVQVYIHQRTIHGQKKKVST
ncbi:unnamed protein product [Rotaria sordida]|uniref:Uncharacterized protein n=1 Tax=Rotaria sordida TaxID=392033 RepID=A0A818VNK7_9BILA|nr:unnamed protein product [Rotaria sordida]